MRFHWINRYRFAFKLSFAIVTALFLGFHLNLVTPRWSVVTAGIVIAGPAFAAGGEPFSGAIRHRGWLRIIGTIAGCIAGMMIVTLLVRAPVVMLTVCCLWISFCTWASTLVREENSYAWGLAGFTALIIVITSASNQTGLLQAPQFAIERSTEIILGIVSAILADLLLSPRSIKKDIDNLAGKLLVAQYQLMQAGLANAGETTIDQRWHQHISQIQTLSVMSRHLLLESAGWERAAQRMNSLNTLLLQMTTLTCETRLVMAEDPQSVNPDILRLFCEPVTTPHAVQQRIKMLHQRLTGCSQQARTQPLTLWIGDMTRALLTVHGIQTNGPITHAEKALIHRAPEIKHRTMKLQQARINGLRTLFATLLGCAIWLWTGWTSSSLFIIMIAVVTSLATHSPTPRRVALDFVLGMLLAIPIGAAFFMLVMPATQQNLLLLSLSLGGLTFLIGTQVQKQRLGSLGTLAGVINILVLSNPMVFNTTQFIDNAAGQLLGSCLGLFMLMLIRDCPAEHTACGLLNGFISRAVAAIGSKPAQRRDNHLPTQYQQLSHLLRLQPERQDKCSMALYLILLQQLMLRITVPDNALLMAQKSGLQQRVEQLNSGSDITSHAADFTDLLAEFSLFQHSLEHLKVPAEITNPLKNLLKILYLHRSAFMG